MHLILCRVQLWPLLQTYDALARDSNACGHVYYPSNSVLRSTAETQLFYLFECSVNRCR
jgi:hypothetical protein